MATKEQIFKLTTALTTAHEKALLDAMIIEDGGTCNFDSPQIILSGWTPDEVREAVGGAELRCDIQKCGSDKLIVDLFGCAIGQGDRRTAMAETVRDSLRRFGYEAYVRYQID